MRVQRLRIVRGGALLVAALALMQPAALAAQSEPRPELPEGADPNNWEAYYDVGIDRLVHRRPGADEPLAWATRLAPDRAEPLYAQWVAFWRRDSRRFEKYLKDDEAVLHAPDVVAADSLRERALQRNPFVHQGLAILLYDALPGRWRNDALTSAWLSYGRGQLELALAAFGRVIERDPAKHGRLHFERASAFVNLTRDDSAAAELDTLLAQLRARDEKALVTQYESKEVLEYARGLLFLRARKGAEAKAAFERSVTENPGFTPSRAKLAEISLALGDSTSALQEYALATEVAPTDVMLRLGYGRALLMSRRTADALSQYRQAVALAPDFADPYLALGVTLERSGDTGGARSAYQDFLTHAMRADSRRATAERYIAALPAGN